MMPEMELFGADTHLSLIPGIWTRLFSYMFWPTDEQQRKAYRAQSFVAALDSIERNSARDPQYDRAYHIVHGMFRQCCGWAALTTGFPGLEGWGRTLRTAAAVLDVIRRTPREGSLNKAIHVISTTAKTYELIGNRTDIREAWKSHRNVAHLGVALVFLRPPHEDSELDEPRQLRRFFAIARDYQNFATSYRMPRQKKPLVGEAEIWSTPADFRTHPLRPLPPLPADMLAALRTYQAPKIKTATGSS
jgi:hypothetical protein